MYEWLLSVPMAFEREWLLTSRALHPAKLIRNKPIKYSWDAHGTARAAVGTVLYACDLARRTGIRKLSNSGLR